MRVRSFLISLTLLAASVFYYRHVSPAPAATAAAPVLSAQATHSAAEKVSPAVVDITGISSVTAAPADNAPAFLNSLSPDNRQMEWRTVEMTAGTGFFVAQDGYILTNKHVVADTAARYWVTLQNGKSVDATVVYRDPNNDLAILKIPGQNYPAAALGDSSELSVGMNVVGIGNAFGQSVQQISQGAVAALHKTVVAGGDGQPQKLSDVIQTSAQLYPGDSGGPLFDASGNVVGIDVAAAVNKNNVSFSIPINDAKGIIAEVTGGS